VSWTLGFRSLLVVACWLLLYACELRKCIEVGIAIMQAQREWCSAMACDPHVARDRVDVWYRAQTSPPLLVVCAARALSGRVFGQVRAMSLRSRWRYWCSHTKVEKVIDCNPRLAFCRLLGFSWGGATKSRY
jgi:hypothetical protein